MGLQNVRIVALIIALCSGLAGCAFNYSVNADLLPAPEASALVQPWPLMVGAYVSPQVRTQEFTRAAAHVPAGQELTSSFRWALSKLFSNVVMLEQPPAAGNLPQGLAGVIELSKVELNEGTAPIKYEVTFHSGAGSKPETWMLVGTIPLWDGERSSLSAIMQHVGTGLSYGLRDQTANLIIELPKQDSVKHWLASAGIHDPQLHPFYSRDPGKGQVATRVMLLPDIVTWRYTDNVGPMNCVGNRLRGYQPPIDVVTMDNPLRLEFFPWLEPSTGPKTAEAFRTWIDEPAIKDKMRDLGVRHLLAFQGGTSTDVPGGGILCGASMGGGGCLGFAWGSHVSAFTASLFDLQDQGSPKELSSQETSGVYIPAFILPIPLMAPTEAAACEKLARDLHEVISREK